VPENKSFKIVIIDDDPLVLKTLSHKISSKFPKAEIFTAENGLDGLYIVIKKRPDVVILDIAMPKLNGLEFLENIRDRKDTYFTNLLIIIFTVEKGKETENRVISDPSTLFTRKDSQSIENIISSIRKYIS